MSHHNFPRSLRERLDGLLFFPVTAFGPDGEVALDVFGDHVRQGVEAGAGAVFACCGTGEFAALDPGEFGECVAAAVEVVAGRVPVIAGAGYGTRLATRFLQQAAQAGADGALVLPPYLNDGGQGGLQRHYEELADATDLELILYQRGLAIFEPPTVVALSRHPKIVGFKDGHGDLDLMQRIVSAERAAAAADGRSGESLVYLNGMPTAEMTQLPYRSIGVHVYSSAVFCFAPDIALAFHRAVGTGDDVLAGRLLAEFYGPLVELRNQGKGYAVALVKAGVRAQGLDVGPVRPPLQEPDPEHVKQLAYLVERGRQIANEEGSPA
jgi:5-dehydro-4-deoxyglucarate dehydratase